jgi:DNA invertase Pin-like site-specific DNA recombinase
LEDAKAGKFDVVLAYKLDRIGRTLLVVVDAHDRLQATGVALRSATEPIDTSTPAGRLIFQMLASFAEFEKETINERTRDGKNRAYRNGVQPGVIPYGYDIAEDGSFVVVEEEADVVRDIFRNIAGGATLFAEAKRLNLQGILSPGKKYRNRPRQHGTTWTPIAISRIVGRSAYSGTHAIHSSTGEIEREVPFIVSGELQEAATAQGEKDRYVKLYAAGHLDEEELEIHLLDLKNRISNLKMLIESAETDLAREEQDATAAKSTATWLTSLRGNLEALEEDTDEAWHGRRELVEELVERITVSRTEDGRAKVHIAYKFAPPVQVTTGVTNDKTFEILAGEIPIPEALGRL